MLKISISGPNPEEMPCNNTRNKMGYQTVQLSDKTAALQSTALAQP